MLLQQPKESMQVAPLKLTLTNLKSQRQTTSVARFRQIIPQNYLCREPTYHNKLVDPLNDAISNNIIDIFQFIESNYNIVIPKPGTLHRYLLATLDQINTVVCICINTRIALPLPTQLSLEVYNDPENNDEFLVLYVRQANYEKNIMEKIEQLRRQFEEEIDNSSYYCLLTTDFRRPV